MSKDKDIDDLFLGKMENEIKNEIKKKRSRLNLKLIIISIISTLVIIIAGTLALDFASDKYIENSYSKEQQKLRLENIIINPNEYIGKETCRETGYFKYESTYEYGKRIGSKVVYAGSVNHLGGLAQNGISKEGRTGSDIPLTEDINKRYSGVYGGRELHFLYPYVHYGENIYEYETDNNAKSDLSIDKENIINDFHFLNEIDNSKIVEMALSFNKEYTYEEVNNMIDSNIITFYWVDDNSDEEKQHNIEFKNSAFSAVGIKSIDGAGEFRADVDDRIENFKAAVKQLRAIDDTKYIINIDEKDIKIIGAVVVGSPKELKAVQDSAMIKHAILGTVVDKY